MEKFIFIQPLIKFSLFYKNRRFTTLLTKRHHWTRYSVLPNEPSPRSSNLLVQVVFQKLPTLQVYQLTFSMQNFSPPRFRWPRGLRRGSAVTLLLGEWVRIPLRARMFVFYEYCLLPGRVICVGPIPSQVESYRVRSGGTINPLHLQRVK
jgi:hypothetical protein